MSGVLGTPESLLLVVALGSKREGCDVRFEFGIAWVAWHWLGDGVREIDEQRLGHGVHIF
jgi:hypothetical protein